MGSTNNIKKEPKEILIVEDTHLQALLLEELLKKDGYRV